MRYLLAFLLALPAWAGVSPGFVRASTPAANTVTSASSTTFTISAANPNDFLMVYVVLKSTTSATNSITNATITNATFIAAGQQNTGATSTKRTLWSSWAFTTGTGGTSLKVNFNSTYTGTALAVVVELQGYPNRENPMADGGPADCGTPGTPSTTSTPSVSCSASAVAEGAVFALVYASTSAVTTQPSSPWQAVARVNDGVNMSLQVNYQIGTKSTPIAASWTLPSSVTCQTFGFSVFPGQSLPAIY